MTTYERGDSVVLHNDFSGPFTTVIHHWIGIVESDLGDAIEYHESREGGAAFAIATYIISKSAVVA